MTQINDIADLVQVLRDHPEWRDTVRGLIVGEELATLPKRVENLEGILAEFMMATNENFKLVYARFDGIDTRLDGMDARFDGIDTRLDGIDTKLTTIGGTVSRLAGQDYESHVARNIERFLRRERGTSATVFSTQKANGPLASLLKQAESQDRVNARESDEVDQADLVLTNDNADEYLLAEVSITVQQQDIDRALERAAFLRKATGRPVTPLAIGASQDPDLQRGQVQVLLMPEPGPPATA